MSVLCGDPLEEAIVLLRTIVSEGRVDFARLDFSYEGTKLREVELDITVNFIDSTDNTIAVDQNY